MLELETNAKRAVECNAKLKRRFGQIEDHDQRQVNEASRSYKMQQPKMAALSVVGLSILIYYLISLPTK